MSPKSRPCSPGGVAGDSASSDAEPEQARDHDRDGGVAPDLRRAAGERDGERRDDDPDRAAEQQRQPDERREDEAGQQRVRERLGAVGEVVHDDPAAERAAGDAEQHDLGERRGA